MDIMAETCVRCGKTDTRRKYEGLPTCGACEGRIRAAHEAPRACPVDGHVMRKAVILDVVIDRCPTCAGVWLDAGELALLSDASRQGGIADSFFRNAAGRL
jgi:hypothetical protein